MKFFIVVALALVAAVMADVSELGYDYPAPAAGEGNSPGNIGGGDAGISNTYIPPAAPAPAPANTYIPPAAADDAGLDNASGAIDADSGSAGSDGYRYRTVRRRVYRHRF